MVIVSLCQVNGQEFGSKNQDITSLYKLEERFLPALDAFIFNRESHLKELEDVVRKMSALRAVSGQDFGEYLGNPLNQFHVVKRFIDDWGNLDNYLKSDTSTDGKFVLRIPIALFPKFSENVRRFPKVNQTLPKISLLYLSLMHTQFTFPPRNLRSCPQHPMLMRSMVHLHDCVRVKGHI